MGDTVGQLTVIAGKKGPVFVHWHGEGKELGLLDQLRNEWQGDATIALVVMMDSVRAVGLLLELHDYWCHGRMYRRGALAEILQDLANDEETSDEFA